MPTLCKGLAPEGRRNGWVGHRNCLASSAFLFRPAGHRGTPMPAASSLKSLSISSRLGLGFGCMLVLLVAVAALGQFSVGKVHDQMQQITSVGAKKAKLVNEMLESVSAIGLQSRSAAMLNDIDNKQSREQLEAVAKTLAEYQRQEKALAELLSPDKAS